MLSRFRRNSVMHGCIDYFCLACEVILRMDKDAITHIDSSIHKKNLGETNYVENCFEDRIRKVNKGYYCECCNVLLTNMLKINLHVKEDNHKLNKEIESEAEVEETVLLKRVGNGVIAFDDLLINENAWNGVIGNTCIICGDEFEDEKIHINGGEHHLKLIQAKVQVGSEKNIYRKIDESIYQCLTCNIIISPKDMATHFEKTEHTKLYTECPKAKEAFNNCIDNKLKVVNAKQSDNTTGMETARNAAETEVTNFEAEQNEDPVTSNGEATEKEVKLEEKEINREKYPVMDENHNKTDIKRPEEAKNAEATSNKSEPSDKASASDNKADIETYTKQNEITYNSNHSFAYCRICKKKIPSTMKSMKEHVNGNPHQLKTKPRCGDPKKPIQKRPDLDKTRPQLYRTKPMEDFISSVTHLETIHIYDTVINDEFCISVLSFAMMTRIEGRVVRCQVCEQTLTTSEINGHSRTWKHDRALKCTPVLYTLNSEFVREVRPGIFHCGYCNLIDAGYDCLQQHLRSIGHKRNKARSEWCLERFLPDIRIHRIREMSSFFGSLFR